LPETGPDFLAALARLHGFEAADARAARVLELGCAQGGNLIPLAARYPGSEFVGIDLSRGQVEEGQAFIKHAGLSNIRLLHGDIAALPDNLGEFDFIIAHGVYSWVPESVRKALLAACRRLLKPQGIAYISFNVEAGWKLYGWIRDALLKQDDASLSPMQRVMRAKETLAVMQDDDERLVKEISYLKTASPSYLFHEYLSEINQPFSFEEFFGSAAHHGLRYLGEAGPRRARVALENDWGLSAEARHERWLEAETRLDDALNTRFRRALLVRDDAPVPGPQQPDQLASLSFSAELASDDELDFSESTEQHFRTRTGERYPVSHPLLKAFLVALAGAWPDVVDYQTVLDHALPLAKEYGYAGKADDAFKEALLDFVQLHGVRLHTQARVSADPGTGLPQPTALAKTQAGSSEWPVTNRFHQALDLDEWGRWLITVMDGNTPFEALARMLEKKLADAGIQSGAEQALEIVENYIGFFRQQGIAV
jgi:SAM-dependent methyltransferase